MSNSPSTAISGIGHATVLPRETNGCDALTERRAGAALGTASTRRLR